MEKFQTLVSLILRGDLVNSYMTYSTDEKGLVRYGRTYIHITDPQGNTDSISIEVNENGVLIQDILDDSFTKEQAVELLNLIKERTDERDGILKKRAWEKLGILNG